MQASDLKDSVDDEDDGSISAVHHLDNIERGRDNASKSFPSSSSDSPRPHSSTFSHASSTRTQFGNTHTSAEAVENLTPSLSTSKEELHESELPYTTVETQALLFGNLLDPIVLSEQTGQFDGHVVFITHPNRDISAHQWSSSSFQWVNIGRYASSRGQVEGSLASDCLRGTGEPQTTLEHFKLAAHNRQRLVGEHGRARERTASVERGVEVDVAVPTPLTYRDPPTTKSRFFRTQSVIGQSLPSTVLYRPSNRTLEDPFVVASSGSIPQILLGRQVQSNWAASTGSLDLGYRFPARMGSVEEHLVPGISGVKKTEDSAPRGLSFSVLLDVARGEQAATHQESPSAQHETFQLLRTTKGHQCIQGRGYGKEPRAALPAHDYLVPGTRVLKPAARQPVPSRPVDPAAYRTSNLNATATPYARITTSDARPGAAESHTSTVDVAPVGLRYSSSDGLRTTQQHAVAKRLNRQIPTPQMFSGPFFTKSQSTTRDPTIALSFRDIEHEELQNQFHYGHRPARQNEHTNLLLVATAANDRTRHLGAISESSAPVEADPYANTNTFARLYEVLSEYAKESRGTKPRSYFTRAWRPAGPELRDKGVDGNASFFSGGSASSRSPGAPSERHEWG